MELVELDRREYQGYPLVFEYETDEHYALQVHQGPEGFTIGLRRERLPQKLHKRFTERLFQRYLARPTAWAVMQEGKPAAIIEVDREYWSNRMRICDLVVLAQYRRRGYGALLMGKAKQAAQDEGFRAIYLDTHTCNVGAIDFYLSQGLEFNGLDTTYYSNRDADKGEVYIEMAYVFRDQKSMAWTYRYED